MVMIMPNRTINPCVLALNPVTIRSIHASEKMLASRGGIHHLSNMKMRTKSRCDSSLPAGTFSGMMKICALLTALVVPAGAAVLAVDDGTWEDPYNGPAGFNIIVFNQFAGTGSVTDVRIDWSGIADGSAFTLGVWSDPNEDGSPDDAVLLTSQAGFTSNGTNSTNNAFFNTYDIADTAVSGSFFVGYGITLASDGAFASFDETNSQEKSWIYFGNLGDVTPATHIEGDGSGNFLIRANLETVPEASSVTALLATLGLFAGRRRR
jgi:hypothetical protein